MNPDYSAINAFVAVARAGGFRPAARLDGRSASVLSDAVRRLEDQLGVRLLHRTTRKTAPTEAGKRLIEEIEPALGAVQQALDILSDYQGRPRGTLKLNVPLSGVRSALMKIVPGFLAAYPDIKLDLRVTERFLDVVGEGCDAGIRYEERLEQDMIAVPIGPRQQSFAAAASPGYLDLHGRPETPDDLLAHQCLCGRFSSGSLPPWEFERDGKTLFVEPTGPLEVTVGGAVDLLVHTAVEGGGIVYLFEDWLRPLIDEGKLEPVLEEWWPSFSGPYLYYPGRRLVPPTLRAFLDYLKTEV